MAFFKKQEIGRVYVLRLVLADRTIIHKVGMCKTQRSHDRMFEILKSWFTKFRYVPYTKLRLDKETGFPEEMEKHLHKMLAHRRYIPIHKVNGGTELFINIDETRLLTYIRQCEDTVFQQPLDLTDEDYQHLGELIAP